MRECSGVSGSHPEEEGAATSQVVILNAYNILLGNKMLRVRASKKLESIDKEDIINYEYRMIELSLPLV
jgi:hypothetical protein